MQKPYKRTGLAGALVLGVLLLGTLILRKGSPDENPGSPERLTESRPDSSRFTESAPETDERTPVSGNETPSASGALAERIHAARTRLPRIGTIREQPESDFHQTPEAVATAAGAIGDLLEYLAKHPEDFRATSRFFAECASNGQVLPAIRALCLHSLRERPDDWATGVKDQIDSLPPSIRELEGEL